MPSRWIFERQCGPVEAQPRGRAVGPAMTRRVVDSLNYAA